MSSSLIRPFAKTGSYAGPDVPRFSEWTDRWGRKRKDFPSFLADIRRQPAAWTWDLKLDRKDAVRLHLVPVGVGMEVALGRGRSPARPESWGLDYVLARRERPKGGISRFLSVIQVFEKTPTIRSIELLSTVPDRSGLSKGFSAGRMARVYNAHRTAMFRIVKTVRKGDLLHIALGRTALMAQGPVVEVGDGTLTLNAHLTFANGRLEPDGSLRDYMLEFKGARLGGWMVKGAVKGDRSQVHLMEPVPADTLRQTCAGKVVSIHHYGIGDNLEIACIAS